MGRPAVLCKLEKGKIIDAQNNFCDTFNWLVDFCNNIRGEGEIDPGKSNLVVDRSIQECPVIRDSRKKVHFVSGDDSNIVFTYDGPESETIKIDVYYV